MGGKRKKMTNREKAFNAQIKKEMQEKGIIPPDKPKLNRKKYVEEARGEWNGRIKEFYAWENYLLEAIAIMLGHADRNFRVSQEAVGAAKCLKLALRLKEFHDKLVDEGRYEHTLREKMEFIEDILDA